MKRLPILFSLIVGLAMTAQAGAQEWRQTERDRKYDFMLVRKDGGSSNWGGWMGSDYERLRGRGPGLYVRKDGALYEIKDAETLKKADEAIQEFKMAADRLKETNRARRDAARDKDREAMTKQHREHAEKIREEAKAFAKEMRKGNDPEARERFEKKMAEFREKMQAFSKAHRDSMMNGEFGKSMREFGRQMQEAASVAGDKIERLIDSAFGRNLAKRL